MQVAVEVRVEPEPRAHRAAVFGGYCNSPVSEDPARATVFNRRFKKCISGEPAPRFQLRPDALFVTDKRDQIARLAAAQHSNQLRQQTRRKCLSTNIQLEINPHRNASFY